MKLLVSHDWIGGAGMEAAVIYYDLRLDAELGGSQASIVVKQGDLRARRLRIRLVNGVAPVALPQDAVAVLWGTKPDGHTIYNDCEINGNLIEHTMTQQALAQPGTLACELTLYSPDGATLATPVFDVYIEKRLTTGDVIESTDEYTGLTDAMTRLAALEAEVSVNEADRVIGEEAREEAETDREGAEAGRAESEAERAAAEAARRSAEQARQSQYDAATKRSEAAAERSETAAEGAATSATGAGASVELAQAAAAAAHAYAEEFLPAEQARQGAEDQRAQAEQRRAEAETARGGAEAGRTQSETARATGEAARAAAEETRAAYYDTVRAQVDSGAFDGTTFMPALDADGTLSWTNDGGKPNPETRNIRGPQGEQGNGYVILDQYATVVELIAAHPTGEDGDAYAVGTAPPYDVWNWSAAQGAFFNMGPLRGQPGADGKSAYAYAAEHGYAGDADAFGADLAGVATKLDATGDGSALTVTVDDAPAEPPSEPGAPPETTGTRTGTLRAWLGWVRGLLARLGPAAFASIGAGAGEVAPGDRAQYRVAGAEDGHVAVLGADGQVRDGGVALEGLVTDGWASMRIVDRIYPGVDLMERFAGEIAAHGGDPWAWVKARIAAVDWRGIHVGDYIPFTCTNGYIIKAAVAGIDPYYQYGDTPVPHHIDFISRDCWPVAHVYNKINYNNGTTVSPSPWLASDIYAWLNSLAMSVPNATTANPALVAVDYTTSGVYDKLPEALKAAIVPKRLLLPSRYTAGSLLSEDNSWAWADAGKLWLPSEMEVYGAVHWGSKNTGFAGGGYTRYPIFTTNLKCIKGAGDGGARTGWWLSSASGGNSANCANVHSYGTANNYNAGITTMRAPVCFRIV